MNPAVAARFATAVLRLLPPEGVLSGSDLWEQYASGTRPRLTEAVLLAGREQQAEAVRRELEQIPNRLVVQADSRDEALAFTLASIRAADEAPRRFLESRTLIVESDSVARRVGVRSGLIVGLRTAVGDSAGLLLERGNSVICPLGNDAPSQKEAIRLTRASTAAFATALSTMGLDDDGADRLARESGRSVTVLFRRIPAVARRDPDWLDSTAQRDKLIPAMLAGGWDSASQEDKAALSVLASVPYEDFEAGLRSLLHVADPPLQQIGTVWRILAPVDLFESLARYVSERSLGALRQTCVKVLSELDPAVELPPDERAYAALHDQVLQHSSWLRGGLTQTILLIAVRGKFAKLEHKAGPQQFTDALIAGLPGLAKDHRLIASLQHQLPLLMEAAPGPLLQALERLLEGDGRRIGPIFSAGGLLGPSSYHTGLLRALEVLAWDPKYIGQAASVLARLATIDPGGRLLNRPLNSLTTILLPWLPSTNATLATRLRILDSVIENEPQFGWQLLASLLPSLHATSMGTSKPRWRDAGASEKETLTRPMVFDTYNAVVDRALAHACDDPDRWLSVIGRMLALDPSGVQKVREALQEFAERTQPDEVRFRVWTLLRDEVNRHRKFVSADWSLSPIELEKFDEIVERLLPSGVVEQNAWLFDDYHPALPEPYDKSDIDVANEPRRGALEAVLAQGGVEGVISLARRAKLPGLVGVAAGEAVSDMAVVKTLLERSADDESLEQFSAVLSSLALRRFGGAWRDWVLGRVGERVWSASGVARVMNRWPETLETWSLVASQGQEVDRAYWATKPLLAISDPDALNAGVAKYIQSGRANEALARFCHRSDELSSELLLDLLDGALLELTADERPALSSNFSFEVGEVLDVLAKRDDVARDELARREYSFLPLLDHGDRPLVLHEFMVKEPQFFVEVLCDTFKAASDAGDQEVTDIQSKKANIGYRLLQSLRRIPGAARDGSIDGGALETWVASVRRLAAQADRSEVAEHRIGKLLAWVGPDPADGAWPRREVRDLLESLRSDEIEDGIRSEQQSKRGVFTRVVFEGGAQERALAERARGWARSARAWPRTAGALERIADMWAEYALREDERAEKDKARLE